MKAIVQDLYGGPEVLSFEDVPTPELEPTKVMVEVRASSVNAADWHLMTGTPYLVRPQNGFRRPKRKIPGIDFAGVIREVGSEVDGLRAGDEVYGEAGGAFAEMVAADPRYLSSKPPGLGFEEAAAIPLAAQTALQGLRDVGRLRRDQNVLINGASGGVGVFAVQIAKALGANVTAVCSPHNVEAAIALGADHVVNYHDEDFVESGNKYDLMFDNPGDRSWRQIRKVLVEGGRHVMVGGPKGKWLGPLPRIAGIQLGALFDSRSSGVFVEKGTTADLDVLTSMIESGAVRPVIQDTYTLAEAAAAMWRFGEGHMRSKIVVVV